MQQQSDHIVTGLFEHFEDASAAVRELESLGYDSGSVSVISGGGPGRADESGKSIRPGSDRAEDYSQASVVGMAGAGAAFGAVTGVLAGLTMMVVPVAGPMLAAGWITGTLASAGVGAAGGALIGTLVGVGMPADDAELFADAVKRGRTLVVVRTSEATVRDAGLVLHRHGAQLASKTAGFPAGANELDEAGGAARAL